MYRRLEPDSYVRDSNIETGGSQRLQRSLDTASTASVQVGLSTNTVDELGTRVHTADETDEAANLSIVAVEAASCKAMRLYITYIQC